MSRTVLNFWLDVTLLLAFLGGVWVTLVLRVVFPAGTTARGWRLWGRSFDQWCDIQFSMWCMFAFGVLLHVMLHWTWVCGVIASRMSRGEAGKKRTWTDGERTLFGVALLVLLFVVLGTALAAAMFTVRTPDSSV